jgi:hypothetical protein
MDPQVLERKAREFLDKNYTKLKPGEPLRTQFIYILEPKSINGMAKFEHVQRDKGNTDTSYGGVKSYTTFKNLPNRDDVYTPIPKSREGWYRSFSLMGNSASSKRFGGRKRKRRTKRKNNY